MSFQPRDQALIDRVAAALSAQPITDTTSRHDFELQFADGRRVVARMKRVSTTRSEDLIGRVAAGAIELRGSEALPLVVISMPHVTTGAATAVDGFVRMHDLPVAWALVGDDGTIALRAPQVDAEIRTRPRRLTRRVPVEKSPFSDLNCWILKVLLLRTAPEDLWGGVRTPAFSPQELARVANVSTVTAYRFVQRMIGADFVRETDRGIIVTRRRELLAAWFAWHAQQRLERIPVRWQRGSPGALEDVFCDAARLRYCVTSFEACRVLGVLHATYADREVHIDGTLIEARTSWKLDRCDERDAHFVLLKSPLTESVFRGRVKRHGLWVADPVQTALDASLHAARGEEQARFVLRDVLGWGDT